MNDPKGTRRRPIQLKFYVNEKELKRIKKKMKVFDIPNFGRYARLMCIDGFIIRIDAAKLMENTMIASQIGNYVRAFVRYAKYRDGISQEAVKPLLEALRKMEKAYEDLQIYYMNTEDGIFHIVDEEKEISDDEV